MSLVRLDHLNLRFGEQHILRDASLTIETGERVRFGISLLGFTAAWRALNDAP